jgi:hypothetical protein
VPPMARAGTARRPTVDADCAASTQAIPTSVTVRRVGTDVQATSIE